jgi:serine/threonine protein kinase
VFLSQRVGCPPVAKILDFGVSKVMTQHPQASGFGDVEVTRTGVVLGTPYYLAPEQARGDRGLDARVDLYACGVMLYEALTGRRPFRAATTRCSSRFLRRRPALPVRFAPICRPVSVASWTGRSSAIRTIGTRLRSSSRRRCSRTRRIRSRNARRPPPRRDRRAIRLQLRLHRRAPRTFKRFWRAPRATRWPPHRSRRCHLRRPPTRLRRRRRHLLRVRLRRPDRCGGASRLPRQHDLAPLRPCRHDQPSLPRSRRGHARPRVWRVPSLQLRISHLRPLLRPHRLRRARPRSHRLRSRPLRPRRLDRSPRHPLRPRCSVCRESRPGRSTIKRPRSTCREHSRTRCLLRLRARPPHLPMRSRRSRPSPFPRDRREEMRSRRVVRHRSLGRRSARQHARRSPTKRRPRSCRVRSDRSLASPQRRQTPRSRLRHAPPRREFRRAAEYFRL